MTSKASKWADSTASTAPPSTPTYNADLTLGGNFAEGRGNAVVSLNYYKREGFTRQERGDWAELPYGEACVSADTWSATSIGVANGSNARGLRGDLAAGWASSFPAAVTFPTVASRIPTGVRALPGVSTALTNAGLAGMGDNGFTFDDAGITQRLAQRPADDFNLTLYNYLQVPQERWMLNAFTHYDFAPKATGYLEFHFSNNRVDQQLTQANIGGDFLLNINNPYLDANMREVLHQLDLAETGPRTLQQGPIAYTTTPNDGLAVLTAGRRLVELPFRHNVDDHNVWRVAAGVKGDLGDASEKFFRNLNYDVYYTLRALGGLEPTGRRSLAQPLRGCIAVQRYESAGGEYLRTEPFRSGRERHQDQCHQRDQCRTESGCGDARRRSCSTCRPGRSISRSASSGARPKRSTFRTSTCVRAMWSASIRACRPRVM